MARHGGRRRRGALLWRGLALGLVVAAVIQELRKAPDDREWHGVLFGFVPYDLRRPSSARLRATLWSPDDPRLVVPRAFGVGWTLNFGRVTRVINGRA